MERWELVGLGLHPWTSRRFLRTLKATGCSQLTHLSTSFPSPTRGSSILSCPANSAAFARVVHLPLLTLFPVVTPPGSGGHS